MQKAPFASDFKNPPRHCQKLSRLSPKQSIQSSSLHDKWPEHRSRGFSSALWSLSGEEILNTHTLMKQKMPFPAPYLSYKPTPTLFINEFVNRGEFECINFALEQSCMHSSPNAVLTAERVALRLKSFCWGSHISQLLGRLFLPIHLHPAQPHVWRTTQYVLILVKGPRAFSPIAVAAFSHHSSTHLPFLSVECRL